jgi:hypothetical protein
VLALLAVTALVAAPAAVARIVLGVDACGVIAAGGLVLAAAAGGRGADVARVAACRLAPPVVLAAGLGAASVAGPGARAGGVLAGLGQVGGTGGAAEEGLAELVAGGGALDGTQERAHRAGAVLLGRGSGERGNNGGNSEGETHIV